MKDQARLFIASLLLLICIPCQAAIQYFSYNWTAANIFDSNNNPPPNGLLTTSGSFTVAFDPEANPSVFDTPITIASSFTDNNGVTLTSADIYSTIRVQTILPDRTYRIDVGAITYPLDRAHQLVGDTNDFILSFFAYGGSGANVGQPTGAPLNFSYFVANGAFAALVGDLSIALTAVSPVAPTEVPLPAALPLFTAALGLGGALGLFSFQKHGWAER